MDKSIFDRPENFTNRELSWLEFNQRILGEARDRKNPLFERLKFLSLTASNLDEFFMVRIASLKDMVNAGYKKKDIAGMTPQEQLGPRHRSAHRPVREAARALRPGALRCGPGPPVHQVHRLRA